MSANQKNNLMHVCVTLLFCLLFGTINALAAEPGAPYAANSMISDQKAGSILVYNGYSSIAAESNDINSRISLTNTNITTSVAVHLFFIDGDSCSVADSYICLTPNQTISFLASDVDPGVTGFLIAVAVDRSTGWPINFNHLIGDVFLKLPSGHFGNLAAESISALYTDGSNYDPAAATATLWLDGSYRPNSYNALPRTLAADNISSRANGSTQYLIVNRIGGDLSSALSPVGNLFGLLYDDLEQSYSFNLNGSACQLRGELNNNFPRTTPRIETVIPSGRTGWMKFNDFSVTGGILGAVFDCNPYTGSIPNAFNGGHNLHKLTFNNSNYDTTNAPRLVMPIFPPSC
jgi:hypothetical protein